MREDDECPFLRKFRKCFGRAATVDAVIHTQEEERIHRDLVRLN